MTAHHHAKAGRALNAVLGITVFVMVIEVIGAVAFNTLALAADAAHMLTDAVALVIAVVAQRVAARPASESHSYGWRRAEVIAAEANAFLLLLASVVVIAEAIRRWNSPSEVGAGGLIAIASVGLVANLVSTAILRAAGSDNMNVRAAALHTLGDAAGALAAVTAGVVIVGGGSNRSDAVAAVVISILIIVAAIRLLRDTLHVLLEATPAHLSAAVVRAALEAEPAVGTVHDLHLWTLAPGSVALSAHVELEGEITLHEAQAEGARLKELLAQRFDVEHSTLELECHPCAEDIMHQHPHA